MAVPFLNIEQLLNKLTDWTDPDNPVLKTDSSGGGGGGGTVQLAAGAAAIGSVAVSSLPGDSLASGGAQSPVTSITTSSGVVIAADSARYELILSNVGSTNYWLNTSAAATLNGLPLPAGSERRFTGGLAKKEWRAISDSASAGEIRPFTGVV